MAAPYATTADLDGWLAAGPYTAPTEAQAPRLLERAWEVIEDHTTPGYVDTTVVDTVTGRTVADVFTDAVCAQVEQWLEVGEENDIAGYPIDTFMSTGISVNRLPAVLAPRARRILRKAALLAAGPARPAAPLAELT